MECTCRAVPGPVGQCSTVICAWYRWCCCVVGVPPGLAAAAGGQIAFRAPGGLPGASVVAVGAVLWLLLSLVSGCGLMLLIGLQLGLFDVVCCRSLSTRWVILDVAGCLRPCSCAAVLALVVRARGLTVRLGVCLSGFLAVVCAVTRFPCLCSYHETAEGTHA